MDDDQVKKLLTNEMSEVVMQIESRIEPRITAAAVIAAVAAARVHCDAVHREFFGEVAKVDAGQVYIIDRLNKQDESSKIHDAKLDTLLRLVGNREGQDQATDRYNQSIAKNRENRNMFLKWIAGLLPVAALAKWISSHFH